MKHVRKIFSRGALLALAVVVVGVGSYWYWFERERAGAPPTAAQSAEPQATPVEASVVETGTVVDQVTVAGTTRSNEDALISAEIAGRITEIHFREGERVDAGALLFSLDDEIYEAELVQAQANLRLSQSTYDRASELFDRGVGAAQVRDEAVARLETDRASVGLAEARLAKTRIRAPFAGIIGLRQLSAGNYVTPGQALVNLEDIDPIKVDFRIPERFLTSVGVGQSVQVAVEAVPGHAFEGEVFAVDPQIDQSGRSILVRATIGNDDGILRPGLFARVDLITQQREEALLVPEQALVPRQGANAVFRIEDRAAVLSDVEVGQRRQGRVEILSGLAAGDLIVTAGQMKLRDGAPVRVIERGERVPDA